MESAIQQILVILKLMFTRMLPILFVVTLIQEKGLLSGLDRLAGWIVRWTGFSAITGQAFIANVGSVYAGSGMLVNLYRDRRISRSYLLLSVIFAAFPAHLRLMLTSTGPVVFSLFSVPVAIFYIGFTFTDALVKLMIAGMLSQMLLPKGNPPVTTGTPNQGTQPVVCGKPTRKALQAALRRTLTYAWRISVFVSVITVVVFYLERLGLFQMLPVQVGYIGLPDEFNTALYAYMGNAYAGMGMIGALLMDHRLNTLEAINLLVFCMMCSRPIVMIKESPSYYFGLYGPANGCLLILFHLGIFIPLCFVALWLVRMI